MVMSTSCNRGRTSSTPARLLERTHQTMGTEVKVTAWTADDARADAAIRAVFGEFDRLDALMSVWKDGSDIVRLNAAAREGAVPGSAGTREAMGLPHQIRG